MVKFVVPKLIVILLVSNTPSQSILNTRYTSIPTSGVPIWLYMTDVRCLTLYFGGPEVRLVKIYYTTIIHVFMVFRFRRTVRCTLPAIL